MIQDLTTDGRKRVGVLIEMENKQPYPGQISSARDIAI